MVHLKKFLLGVLRKRGIIVIKESFYNYLVSPSVVELLDRYKIACHSVLHIGGHLAEEASLYKKKGIQKVTFIEGDPETFGEMLSVLEHYPGYLGIGAMLSNENSISEFFVASNNGASSSILEPKRHLIQRPDIEFNTIKKVETVTLDSLNLGVFDLLVLDVQGAELKVIQGGMETIRRAKAIWIEVNAGSMYKGDANSSEVISILEEYFVPLYMNMGEDKWGDALLISKSLI
jgi:FkbM family methyltransferase